MIVCQASWPPMVVLLAALAVAIGCGDDGDRGTRTDEVREAALAYVRALRDAKWTRACGLMTTAARRDVEGAAGESCPRALASGGALPADQLASAGREVAGARVRLRGRAAMIGPLGTFPQPLRLERVGDRWLVAG